MEAVKTTFERTLENGPVPWFYVRVTGRLQSFEMLSAILLEDSRTVIPLEIGFQDGEKLIMHFALSSEVLINRGYKVVLDLKKSVGEKVEFVYRTRRVYWQNFKENLLDNELYLEEATLHPVEDEASEEDGKPEEE